MRVALATTLAVLAPVGYVNPTPGKDVALQVPGMHRAKAQRNLVYAAGRRLDVYRPAGAGGRRLPAVLFIHGSGYGPLDAYYEQSSPTTYLEKTSLPVLVAKAGRDLAAINSSIDRFVAKGRRVGGRVELLVHPTGHHGFDAHEPVSRTLAILRRTLAFLRTQLLR